MKFPLFVRVEVYSRAVCFLISFRNLLETTMELINKGMPPFSRTIYETGLALSGKCNRISAIVQNLIKNALYLAYFLYIALEEIVL